MNALADFVLVASVAMLVPGPDTLVVLRTSLAEGPRAGTWAAAGSGLGNLIWGSATVAGVTTLVTASETAFTALHLAGAAYLAMLGVRALAAAWRGETLAPTSSRRRTDAEPRLAFRRGLASDLLNVKVGLFWTALVPQFVHAGASPVLPVAMVATMGVLAFAWLSAYAHLASRMSRTLALPGASAAINGTLGVFLLGFGAHLAG
jgi:threonine/homoserine/homoserine lactone efflux protein